ncbi:mCG148478 [Mus musculus]|uniref:UROP11-110 n=1 Tax=Mus musculus TaxID=10090 RepID=Q80WG6_MOUSE|nr:mCG148478 [Mus musculus]CAD90042.1 UROP11-110 [Mus musculus]
MNQKSCIPDATILQTEGSENNTLFHLPRYRNKAKSIPAAAELELSCCGFPICGTLSLYLRRTTVLAGNVHHTHTHTHTHTTTTTRSISNQECIRTVSLKVWSRDQQTSIV